MAALNPDFSSTRVLILVKTYPQPSRKHEEVVCTAGVTEEGEWVRLYPIDFRKLPRDKQFGKYQWVEIDLAPRGQANDNRLESRRPYLDSIKILGPPLPTKDKWIERRKIVDRLPVRTMDEYDALYEEQRISLGIVKPSEVLDLKIEAVDPHWTPGQQGVVDQLNLFASGQTPLKKIPYKFSYVFKCHDSTKTYTRMIEDWEIGALYLKEERNLGDPEAAANSVRRKFLEDLFSENRDSHFFVGTIYPYNTWIIIGIYYPPRQNQGEFDF